MVASTRVDPEIVSTLEVPVIRLDAYVQQHGIERIALIKIDAEGIRAADLKRAAGIFRANEAAAGDIVRNRAGGLPADGAQSLGTGGLHGGSMGIGRTIYWMGRRR